MILVTLKIRSRSLLEQSDQRPHCCLYAEESIRRNLTILTSVVDVNIVRMNPYQPLPFHILSYAGIPDQLFFVLFLFFCWLLFF